MRKTGAIWLTARQKIFFGGYGKVGTQSAQHSAGEPAVEIAFDHLAPFDHIVV
jgi:hypothetical protein